jgi:hypothetical protein
MTSQEISIEFEKVFGKKLAEDLLGEFIQLKIDVQTKTLSRASAGKFIETIVQILEFLETGNYSAQPSVDSYLKNLESRTTILSDDLKICVARVSRSVYTLRNKRNILHKGSIDPNLFDLKYIYSAAQWLMTELVRLFVTSDLLKAQEIIEFIQVPVNHFAEKINKRTLILAKCSVPEEIFLLLYTIYPDYLKQTEINQSLDRRSKSSISNSLKDLWKKKLIHKDESGFKLTQLGFISAKELLKKIK